MVWLVIIESSLKSTKIAVPLTRLTKKTLVCTWDGKCTKAFEKMKELLTNALVLTIPDGSKYFTVHIDACRTGIESDTLCKQAVEGPLEEVSHS